MIQKSINHFFANSKYEPNNSTIQILPVLILLVGFSIRFFAFHCTPIINPDGTLYIQQAKAIYYGLNNMLTACFPYLSIYPIFIVGSFKIFGDWIVAAKTVSLIFGSLSLIPLYLMLRRFFDETIASFSLLIFALNPAFIDVCGKVVRGPIYWFFSLFGLYLFILHIERKKSLYLILSTFVLFIAAWARIEAILYIIMSFVYMVVISKEKKLQNSFFFLLPVILIFAILIIYNIPVMELFAPQRITNKISTALANYQTLRANLGEIIDQRPIGISPYFLPKVKNLLWFIAIGALFVQIIRAFFLPFFLIFVLGIGGLGGRIKRDPRLLYLVIVSIAALAVLYIQTLDQWAIVNRHISLFLFPSFVLIGFGLEKIIYLFKTRFQFSQSVVYAIICLLIFSIALPKNLKRSEDDKILFKEIGEFISNHSENKGEILIAGSFKRIRLIHFYANLNYPNAPCFNINSIFTDKNKGSMRFLKKNAFHYFIWDEKNWTKKELNTIRNKYQKNIIELKECWSPKLGKIILFKVV
ncbi:MAG: glycosyltransferase family 39 protein [Desulfatiglandales bacterium]